MACKDYLWLTSSTAMNSKPEKQHMHEAWSNLWICVFIHTTKQNVSFSRHKFTAYYNNMVRTFFFLKQIVCVHAPVLQGESLN